MTQSKKIQYPRIHLAVDNCFAIKRWVEPFSWMQKIKEIGDIRYIQASTDNEIDPSHNTQDFRNDWIGQVKSYEAEMDLEVISLYSGYATYRTVGIASLSKSKRHAMIEKYFKPVVDVAACLGAQVGNTLSAYSDTVLQKPELYKLTTDYIESCLGKMALYAGKKGVPFSYEQMYTPTQGMWTIEGCISCMKRVYALSRYPMYVTIDTAHQAGQSQFLRPKQDDIMNMIQTGNTFGFRLPDEIRQAIAQKQRIEKVEELFDRYNYWFAQMRDADLYEWLGVLGAYSPVIHLQQTDGTYSSHKPFIEKYNAQGIVKPIEVLKAIARSCVSSDIEGMPPKVSDIYLAFEIFFGVMEPADKIIADMRDTVAYWREYVPEDGVTLDKLIENGS